MLRSFTHTVCSGFLLGATLALLSGCKRSGDPADSPTNGSQTPVTVVQHATIIDGTGAPERRDVALLIQDSLITRIAPTDSVAVPAGATVIDATGKTIMPTLVAAHGHLGLLRGTTTKPGHYTHRNVMRHLQQYEQYGVDAILSLGTDQDSVVAFRADSRAGKLPGATIFSAIHGIGVPGGAPDVKSGANQVLRPHTAEEARQAVRQLAPQRPDVIKIWVDDMGGKMPKMKPEVYRAVLDEAQKQHIRVAAHVYYLADAKDLVAHGVSILAHSIRDQEVDDALVREMKQKYVYYIPTLTLDQYQFAYAGTPEWMNDPFFLNSLEPGVLDSLKSAAYKDTVRTTLPKKKAGYEIALRNLKKLADGGVPIALGTDSGAEAIRTQGFSEHLEMEDMAKAGLKPGQILMAATLGGANLLGTDQRHGSLAPGKFASFIILDASPLADIRNTRKIDAVWRAGRKVAGPVAAKGKTDQAKGSPLGRIIRDDARLDQLLDPSARPEIVADGFEWLEGPVWVESEKGLLFSNALQNEVLLWTPTGGVRQYLHPSGYTGRGQYSRESGSNGLTLDLKGQLVSCEHGDRRVSVLTSHGGKRTLADNYQGKRFNSPNDAVYRRASGDLYFTDPPYGLPKQEQDPSRELAFAGLYRLTPAGQLTLLYKDLKFPNGVALSPDEKTLYLACSDPKKPVVLSFPVLTNGTLGTPKTFIDFTTRLKEGPGLPDGLKVDQQGHVYVAGPGGIHVLAPDGAHLGRIDTEGVTAPNLAWGDANGSTLYITASKYILRLPTKTKGANWVAQ